MGWLRAVLGVLLLVIVAAALLMIGAGQRLTRVSGASAMRPDAEGHIWLLLDGALLRLSPDGAIETRLDPEALGLGQLLSLAPLPDGRVWVGSKTQRKLFLLDRQGKRLGEAAPPPAVGPIFGAFHMAYEPRSDRLIVADTQNHRLLAFTGGGEFVGASSALQLRFPNDLAVDPQGQILLANTNRNAVLRLQADLGAAPAGEPFKAGRFPDLWPVFMGVARGAIYVSWHEPSLRRGKVLAYDADGRYLQTLEMEPEVEPQGLLARDTDVLVAVLLDHAYSIRRFSRSGEEYGPFGSAEVQGLLAAASASERQLRALRSYSRKALIGAALLLLIGALRLRRRQELAAARAVMLPSPGMSRGMVIQIVLLVAGLFLVLLVLQLFGFGLTGLIALQARHSGSTGLMLAARLGMPLLMGLMVYGVAIAWRATPSFVAMQNGLMRRRAQAWGPYLPKLLRPGEQVEDFAVATGLWRAYLLLFTTHRLLLLPATPASARLPLWQAGWHDVGAPRLVPRAWWRWLMNPVSLQLEIPADGLPQPVRVSSLNRQHAEQLLEAVRSAQQRAFGRTQLLPELAPEQLAEAAAAAAPELPPVQRSVVLSLLFPGLGHLDQGRTRLGLGLMLLSLVLLSSGLLSWAVSLRRFADQPFHDSLVLALMYAPVLAYAVWDVQRYARQDRLAAAG
jgi:hypothetical protein